MKPMMTKRNRILSGLGVLGGLSVVPGLAFAGAPRVGTKAPPVRAAGPVDFDRDVRPILSENCFACHGFDAHKRQANLRLDTADGAYQKLESGDTAVVPGKPESSALVSRVEHGTMPPASFGKKLTPAQVATLRRWVAQGGKYAQHWSFVAPKRPALPAVKNAAWCRNPIDRFILAKLEKEGLKPSPEADRRTLIRRVTFDLTGLPPTLAEVNAFLADRRPDAYERVVDRLLASPHYGERMALQWLDAARYADTHGYHIDPQRDMWPWRDWVIRSYNSNLPYDQFVVWQLAGDLLPNATLDQKIATGFNRNHPINFEGGAIPEEYQAAYIFDRIDTTSTVFMGLTMRCCQCHDHKYDPLTQKDFYRFYAFFNSNQENGLDGTRGNAVPFLKAPTQAQQEQLAADDRRIAELERQEKERASLVSSAQATWEKSSAATLVSSSPVSVGLAAHYSLDQAGGTELADLTGQQPAGRTTGAVAWTGGKFGNAIKLDGASYADLGTSLGFDRTDHVSYGAWIYPTSKEAGTILSRMNDAEKFRGWDLYLQDGRAYVHMIHEWDKNALRVNTRTAMSLNQWHHVFVTYDGSGKAKGVHIYVDGKTADLDITHDSLTDTIRTTSPAHLGRRNPGALFKGMIDEVRFYTRELTGPEVAQVMGFDAIRQILATAEEKRTPQQKEALNRYYLENFDPEYRRVSTELAAARKSRADLDNSIPTTMVFQEMAVPRDTFMLIRGQYDKKGEKVTPGTPAVLPALHLEKEHATPTRLDLAKWLVDPSHPLTARVAVNRYWQMYFGNGIVRSTENFGTQGDRPTHPELLDWLATEFEKPTYRPEACACCEVSEAGRKSASNSPSASPALAGTLMPWDVKRMQRLIVTSATYRQASRVSPAMVQKDPENLLYARGPRFRLPAEFIRDQALAVSGLLVDKIGGPAVKPYQPKGLWEEISFGAGFSAQTYVQDHGEALYRRSMYTFWKRTCPPPSLQTFDAPEREFCIVRRSVSNTPLQALVLMNDPTYVEAARKLAERVLTEIAASPSDRIVYAYRLVLARMPRREETQVLLSIHDRELEKFRQDPAAAKKLLSIGESPHNEQVDQAELAAWTTVASTLLNTDEAITKN